MVKFIKSVPFILKRLRRREGGRDEDNASSIVGMKKPFLLRNIITLRRNTLTLKTSLR